MMELELGGTYCLESLRCTRDDVRDVARSGANDEAVSYLVNVPSVRAQLERLDRAAVRAELKEYGAWDETELADAEQNLHRIVWLACWSAHDNGALDD